MRGEVVHGRGRTGDSDGHDHVAELRQGRVGQNAFDVVLLDGHQRRHQRCYCADPRDDEQCRRVEDKKDAAEHVHTGGHHCRRVNQRADRRGAFHRVRQPDVQGELRGLANRAAEDQQSGNRCHRTKQRRILFQLVFDERKVESACESPDH